MELIQKQNPIINAIIVRVPNGNLPIILLNRAPINVPADNAAIKYPYVSEPPRYSPYTGKIARVAPIAKFATTIDTNNLAMIEPKTNLNPSVNSNQ